MIHSHPCYLCSCYFIMLFLTSQKVHINFQAPEEKINLLLFMDDLKLYAKNKKGLDSLVQTVRIFSDDIGMEFGIYTCTTLVLKRGKLTKFDEISLPDGTVMKVLIEEAVYKYLGVIQADQIRYTEMKEKVKTK